VDKIPVRPEGPQDPYGPRGNGGCPICGRLGRALVQDHDHVSGRNRGRICRACNRMLADAGSFVRRKDLERWERANRGLATYLRWWGSHPSAEGYTGAGWVNGVYVKSRGRAFIRAWIRSGERRGYVDWAGNVPRRTIPPPMTQDDLDRRVEEILDRIVKTLTCPVVERPENPKRVLAPEQKARVRARIAADETFASVGLIEHLAPSTIWRIVHSHPRTSRLARRSAPMNRSEDDREDQARRDQQGITPGN
jgi:hypothetical protein